MCVDDHAFLAEGLKTRLSMERDIAFVAWLGAADDLVETARREKPDVVLLDIEMPGKDPFEAIDDLRRALPSARVIVFSAYVRDRYIDDALNRGAWGYLSKGDSPDRVVQAIRAVAGGEFAFGETILERTRASGDSRPSAGHAAAARPPSRIDLLTPRELQILRMIGKGMSRQDIADSIHRSAKTVDNHRAAIMEKLQIHDRTELALFAVREGLAEA